MNELISAAEWHRLLSDIVGQDIPRLDPDDDLVRELGLDSLARLRLLAGLERHFQVCLPDARLAELRSLRQVADAIAAAPKAPSSPGPTQGPWPTQIQHRSEQATAQANALAEWSHTNPSETPPNPIPPIS